MSKPNKRHTEKCKQYKTEGRREKNKAIKQERHKRRIERFKKRKEEGKKRTKTVKYPIDTFASYCDAMPEFQRMARFFGRMHRDISAIREAERHEEIKNRKISLKGKPKDDGEVE